MKRRRVTEAMGAAAPALEAAGTRFDGFRVASVKEKGRMTVARACHTLLGLIVGLGLIGVCSAVGYSYTRFEGPVAGPEHLVTVHNGRTDYVARPEYSFAYGVEDGTTRVLQNRKETRNGDEVRGVYSVVDPDGTLRVVKYTADDANGFQAEVITNGVKTLHGHGEAGSESHDGVNAGAGAGASVDEQVRHVGVAETDAETADDEEQGNGNAHYKVHEDYEEGEDDGEEKEKGGGDEPEEEGGGDHQEYEGSSEEGYDEADAHSQQQQQESSEEY